MSYLKSFKITSDRFRQYYFADIERIRDALRNEGWACSENDACTLWELYSDSLCASWMILPDSDIDIFKCVERFMIPEEEQDGET